MRLRSASRELMREINQALVLRIIRDQGPIPRSEIARRAHLSLATVSGITGELIERGLVYEHEVGASTGGRPPILLALNPRAGLMVGVKLTETQVVAALTDLGAEIVERRAVPLGPDHRPEAVATVLADLVAELRSLHPEGRILGLGLGMAGAIDRPAGVCRFSPFFGWRDVPLRDLLEERLELPVAIENDVNTLTLAEQWFGAGVGVADFLVVTLGRGVGMGMVLDGRLYRGGRGAGGEFGHLTIEPDGPTCPCGKRGCLEALVADPALVRAATEALGRPVDLLEAAALARSGDPAMDALFARAGRMLGLALAHLVNVFNPTLLIVGGEGVQVLDLLMPATEAALTAHCFDGLFADLHLVVEPWGDDAWARGAASLMLDEFFRPDLDGRRQAADGKDRSPLAGVLAVGSVS
jgi:predicted NBD/HSP70 family sugar kinase